MNRWSETLVVLLTSVGAIACDTSAPPAPGEWTGREWDAGSSLDAGRTSTDGGPFGSCVPEYFELATEAEWIGSTDLLADSSTTLAWSAGGELWTGVLSSDGTLTSRERVDIESDSPSLAAGVVVWAERGIEHSRALARVDGLALRLGSSAADEILPVARTLSSSFVAAWLELTEDDTRVVARIWPDAEVRLGGNVGVERPAVATRESAAYIAWRTDDQLHLSRVDVDGVDTRTIDTNHPPNGGIAISMHATGGLLAFESTDTTGATSIFGIRLAPDASPRGAELRLSENAELDAAIRGVGTFHGGYVIGYVGTPPGGSERLIRLSFVHGSTGDRVHTLDLASDWNEDAVALSVAPDGTIFATWASERRLIAARVDCGEVWLRCSAE